MTDPTVLDPLRPQDALVPRQEVGIPGGIASLGDDGRLTGEQTPEGTFLAAAKNPESIIVGTVTVDASDLVTSAAVVWPDGTSGVMTITARHSTGAVTSYQITYGDPVTKTFTQPDITRTSTGAITNVPQIVIT